MSDDIEDLFPETGEISNFEREEMDTSTPNTLVLKAIVQVATILDRPEFSVDDVIFCREMTTTMLQFMATGDTTNASWALVAVIVTFEKKGISKHDMKALTDLMDELAKQ